MSAITLRSLLLAGRATVSTQHAANSRANAAPRAVGLLLACWFWLIGAVFVGLLAAANGAERNATAAATALALAPSLVGFTLFPRLGHRLADLGWLAVWLTALTGLVAGTGGASSPLAAGLLIVPALTMALGRPWAPEAGAAAVVGYVLAAFLARYETHVMGPYAELMTAMSIAFAAGVMALGRARAPSREAAMSQRVAEVSHELRTPLTHILGFSEMIERQIFGEIGTRYVEYAGLIRKSGTHLLGLVNDLLDLSRIEAGRYELDLQAFDVRAVVEEVVRLSADSAEKKQIALGMITPEAPLMVRADDRAVKRMLINTVGNAIKFTPEGGRVMVSAAAVEGALALETADNGPGIPEEERETLGQAYERGSGGARAEGTGLGLSLVRALAELHGGALSFHDAPQGGALVRITLPVLVA
jgi:signal transduction histidine kinase